MIINNKKAFNSFEIGRSYFEFENENSTLLKNIFEHSSICDFIPNVIYYLIKTNEDKMPQDIIELLRKYEIMVVYWYLKDKFKDKVINDELDKILFTHELKDLPKKRTNNFMYNYYANPNYMINNKSILEKDVLKHEIKKLIGDEASDSLCLKIYSLFRLSFPFFGMNSDLSIYTNNRTDKIKRNDMLVSECMVEYSENENNLSFEFEILTDEEFLMNFNPYNSKGKEYAKKTMAKTKEEAVILTGYIIHYYMQNKKFPEKLTMVNDTKLVTGNRDFFSGILTYTKPGRTKNDIYFVKPELIKPFDFIYNGKKYHIDGDSITEI